jgi:tetratricopeptide (TPR) repeat protein
MRAALRFIRVAADLSGTQDVTGAVGIASKNQDKMQRTCWRILTGIPGLLLCLFAPVGFSTSALAARDVPLAQASAPDPLELALDHLRNLEYDAAQKEIESWLDEHPDDLRGLNYLGNVMLQREMFRRELLESQVYGPGGAAFRGEKVPLPAGFQPELFGILGKAEGLAESRLKQNPRDEEALFWGGVAHVTRAIFRLSLTREHLAALGEAKEARKLHARLLALNPGFVDALLVVGTYDYVVGSLPWYMKVLASLVGYRGDRTRGLEEIKRVTEQGHWAREEAKSFLAILYFREKRYAEALAILQGLSQSYPRNFLLPQEMARVYKAQGDWRAAATVYSAILARYAAHEPGYGGIPLAKILYQAGQARVQLGETEEALRLYDRAANLDENDFYVHRAELAAAGLCLQMNQRAEALRKYERVAKAVPNSEEGKTARRFVKQLQESR